MQIGVALLIEYTAPVAVVGWLWLRRGQRPGRLTVLGVLLGAAGLVLVLDLVSGGSEASTAGILWALAAMVGCRVLLRALLDEDTAFRRPCSPPPGSPSAGSSCSSPGNRRPHAEGVDPRSRSTRSARRGGCRCSGLGVVTPALAYGTGIAAARRLGSSWRRSWRCLEVLVALVAAWLLLGEMPRLIQVAGGVLIMAGVVSVKLGEPAPTTP